MAIVLKDKERERVIKGSDARLLVKQQAKRHTRRLAINDLYSIVRPNEPASVELYRNAVKRMLTKDGYDRWCSKIGRIIESAGLNIDRQTLNENTAEWLAGENFYYLGQYCGLQEYALRLLIPTCAEDPNAMVIHLPVNPENPFTPLSRSQADGGLPANTIPAIDTQLIPVEDIIETTKEYFVYYSFEVEVYLGRTEKVMHRVKFLWDKENVWIWWPYYEKGELKYEPELWYNHNFGFVPFNYLPGRLAISETGEYYNESFLQPYYEYGDEFVTSFSDVQANRVTHLYPKVVMAEMPCPAKGCTSGKIKIKDESGKIDLKDCSECGGSGIIRNPGPYGVIIQQRSVGINGEPGALPKALEYITPPTEVFNVAWEKTFELLEKGKRAVGLDLLLNLNESGVAMEHRLEDLEDMLKDFGGSLIDTLEVMLECIDAILNFDPAQRKAPKIVRPKKYDIKGQLGHKMDYDNALPFDRYNSAIGLIQNKYKGDDVKQKIYKVAFKYAPVLLLSESEFISRLASGTAQTPDVVKRDNVIMILTEIADELGEVRFLDAEYSTLVPLIDAQIQALIPEVEQGFSFTDDNGEPIE